MKLLQIVLFLLFSAFGMAAGERGIFASVNLYRPSVGRSVKPRMKVLAVEERDGYECRLVEFSVGDREIDGKRGERVKGYLLVPDEASWLEKRPAVLMLHDHGARFDIGKEKLVRPVASDATIGRDMHVRVSSQQWIDVNFDGVYLADSLAALGYVVLVSDALYWGDRSTADAQLWSRMNYDDSYEFPACDTTVMSPDMVTIDRNAARIRKKIIKKQKNIVYEGQRAVYDSLAAGGVIWAEKTLREDVAATRLLARLPFVDRKNVGAFGFSMGAHRCWLLSAFCGEVKCGAALSWMTSLDGYEGNNASDLSMRIQPMRDRIDFGDIGHWLAPKPMLFLNGAADRLFPADKVQIAFEKLRKHYSSYNASHGLPEVHPPFEPLQTVFFNGGHHCGKDVQETIVDFFDENLRP